MQLPIALDLLYVLGFSNRCSFLPLLQTDPFFFQFRALSSQPFRLLLLLLYSLAGLLQLLRSLCQL